MIRHYAWKCYIMINMELAKRGATQIAGQYLAESIFDHQAQLDTTV